MTRREISLLRRLLRQGRTAEAIAHYLRAGRRLADIDLAGHRMLATAYCGPRTSLKEQFASLEKAEAALRRISKRWKLDELLKNAASGRIDDPTSLMRAELALSRLHHYGMRISEGFLLRLLYEFSGRKAPKLMLMLPTGEAMEDA